MTRRRGHGEGSIYQRADGMWIGAVDLGLIAGKRTRKTVSSRTKQGVIAKLAVLRRDLADGIQTDRATFGAWAEYWRDSVVRVNPSLSHNTKTAYTKTVDLYLVPLLGKIRLAHLQAHHVREMDEALRNWERKTPKGEPTGKIGLSPSSIAYAHSVGRMICEMAVAEGKMRRNPFMQVKSPTASRHHEQLDVEEARKVIRASRTHAELVRALCGLALGMRAGEARGLRWADVHEDAPIPHLEIRHGVTRGQDGRGMVVGAPKTSTSRRVIPIPDPLVAPFAALRASSGGRGFVFPGADELTPLVDSTDSRRWAAQLKRAGVRQVPRHGSRGTCATLLMEMGVPDRVIADILGHANVRITNRAYLRSTDDSRAKALGGLAEALDLPPLLGLPIDN